MGYTDIHIIEPAVTYQKTGDPVTSPRADASVARPRGQSEGMRTIIVIGVLLVLVVVVFCSSIFLKAHYMQSKNDAALDERTSRLNFIQESADKSAEAMRQSLQESGRKIEEQNLAIQAIAKDWGPFTDDDYNKITVGMSLAQVTALLGRSYSRTSVKSNVGDMQILTRTRTYGELTDTNARKCIVSVVFLNDKVASANMTPKN